MITCDEVIDVKAKSCDEETKTVPKSFNDKNIICNTQNLYISLAVLLITTALLIAVSIYCYVIRYRAKQKHLLPLHVTNNELREVLY